MSSVNFEEIILLVRSAEVSLFNWFRLLVKSRSTTCIKSGLGGSEMPSKTWSIMSCGRPVIASIDEGELKDIIEKNECGVFTHAGNVDEFVEAVCALAADPGCCAQMGLNARQFILQNLTKEVAPRSNGRNQ